MSVMRLMRRPSRAGGKPATGNAVLVMPIRWRSNAAPYVRPPVAEPPVVAITVLMAVRRLMDMFRSVSVLGPQSTAVAGPETEDRRPRTGDRGPETEDRRPRTGDRGPETEDRGLSTEDGILKSHEPV